MPSQEPNSKMDELLRAYAKKRREQAEPVAELHPATRTLLQEEVKRTFAAMPTPTRQSWRAWRWPLLVLWGGMAVLLVMFAMLNTQLRSLQPGMGKEEVRSKKDERIDTVARNPSPAAARIAENAARDARRGDRDGRAPQEIGSAVVSTAPASVSPAAPAAHAGVAGLDVTVAPSAPHPATFDAPLSDVAATASLATTADSLDKAKSKLGVPTAVAARSLSPAPASPLLEPKLADSFRGAVPLLEPKLDNSPAPAVPLPEPKLDGQPSPVAQPDFSLAPGAARPATPAPANVNKAAAAIPSASAQPPVESAAREARRSDRDSRAPQTFGSAVVSTAPAGVPPAANAGPDVAAGNFVQVHDRARKGAAPMPPSNLLSNFRMWRSGQNVSVLDADGSVYNGQVLNAISSAGATRGGGGARQEKPTALKDALEDANWNFNVTGFNNSLNQHISFTGNVLDMPAASAFSNAAAQNRNASQFQNTSNAAQAPSTQNSRITGKVQVGGGKPYEIEAKPPVP